MSYGTFFNQVGNVCLYNGVVATGLQYPLINCSAALLSTVAGANWQTLANKMGITSENDTTHAIAASLTVTSVTTGMLLKAGFAVVPGLQLASFTLGVSCKLIGWYLSNQEAAATLQTPEATPLAREEKKPALLASSSKNAVAHARARSRSMFAKQKLAASKCALRERHEQARQFTRRATR